MAGRGRRGGAFGGLGGLLALVLLALIAWRLSDVILLAFGAVLIAVLLHALADPLVKRLGAPRNLSLVLAVAAVAVGVWGAIWLFGQQLSVQLAALQDLLPRAWTLLQQRLSTNAVGQYLLGDIRRLHPADGWLMSFGSQMLRGSASAAAGAVIVSFAGLYLAFHPRTYAQGALQLVPPAYRARTEQVALACGQALNRWLTGQVISMLLVAVTVALGLTLVGVPSAMALGLVAGLGQLVPVLGPMATTVPGLIVASSLGLEPLAWTTAVYVGAMQFEANLITPLVLRRMVEVPMAVTLFAVLAMGVLFGGLGVLFATPLVVVAYVVVRMAYVEGVLGDKLDAG